MKKEILNNLKNITLLYVEDDDDTREQLEYFLEKKVGNLHVAKNGEEGFEVYKKESPDIVLTDIQMPKCDGISMSRLIKEYSPDAKIIILSAFNDSEYIFEAIKINITMYKTKPINMKDLIEGLAKLANDINLEKENKKILATLNQYKNTVDLVNIVSKTDISGKITYVNDKFEEISGYKENELIGKAHNIVRHEDMSSETFKEMWKTIKEDKKLWKGRIKNKRKDGSAYYVDTVINPILDENNEIIEFIAIRTEIT